MPTYRGADGTELHYDVRDRRPDPAVGSTIVVLAGGPARHPDYLGDLAGLDTRHELILPHLRGVGRSPLSTPAPPGFASSAPAPSGFASSDPAPSAATRSGSASSTPAPSGSVSSTPVPPGFASSDPALSGATRSGSASSRGTTSGSGSAASGVAAAPGRVDGAGSERVSYWRQAEDLEARRVELGVERINLLGHSAGTRMALSYAVRFPERVASLVLVTPPADYLTGVVSDAPELKARYRSESWYADAAAAVDEGPATADDRGLTDFYARVAPLGYAGWDDAARAHARVGALTWAATQAYMGVDVEAELRAGLDRVTAPVLVVAGAQDALTGLAPVVALARRFPQGQLAVIQNCGHFPWVEQPAAFRAAVDAFLAALPG